MTSILRLGSLINAKGQGDILLIINRSFVHCSLIYLLIKKEITFYIFFEDYNCVHTSGCRLINFSRLYIWHVVKIVVNLFNEVVNNKVEDMTKTKTSLVCCR